MTYNEIYRILSFEKTKLIQKNNYVQKTNLSIVNGSGAQIW